MKRNAEHQTTKFMHAVAQGRDYERVGKHQRRWAGGCGKMIPLACKFNQPERSQRRSGATRQGELTGHQVENSPDLSAVH